MANVFFHSVGCLFILWMSLFFLCCAETFEVDVVPFFFFLPLFPLLKEIDQKKHCYKKCLRFYWLFSSRMFMVSSLTFKSLIHIEFILVYGVRRWSSFIFCKYLSNFPNTIYWIYCLYSIVCSCLLCQILIGHRDMALFLGFLFCSISPYVCLCQCHAL